MNYLRPLRTKLKPRPFAVYDLETTTDLEKVYMVGFYDGELYRVFESEPKRPELPGSAIDKFLSWLLSTGRFYSQHRIYAHNGGNFDVLYLIKWFISKAEQYWLRDTPLQSSVLALEVGERSAPNDGKSYRNRNHWLFLDSYRLMNASLDSIGKAYGLGGKVKGKDGEEIDYTTLHRNPKRYEYLKRDCTLLYDCLSKFYTMIRDMGGDVGITAPSTAMLTYRRRFLDAPIPTNRHCKDCSGKCDSNCMHDFIRRAYYGGRVEVYRESYKPTGRATVRENGSLNLGDFNSMYPAAMRADMPTELQFERYGWVNLADYSQHLLGFVECTVNYPPSYLPVLPYRSDDKLVFPVGKFSGVWSSVELQAALSDGAVITDWGKSAWFSGRKIFVNYVDHLYRYRDKTRADYDLSFDLMAKLLLNSLYGKMGMVETREKLWFYPSSDDFAAHTLSPIADIVHGVYSEVTQVEASYVIPHIAAWVTALARVKLWQTMRGYLKRGYDVYYCDTDSIITNAPMRDSKKLGEIKLVCKVKRAHFAAPKLYLLETENATEVKAKGFSPGFGSSKLDEKAYWNLVKHRKTMTIKRIVKLREGLRDSCKFPRMKTIEKGLNSLDTKRLHLTNGNTTPLEITSP